jgi:hypothetical protein
MPRDGDRWNPDTWKPQYPNPAFRRARADDRFWAARRVVSMTDDLIRAAVRAGRYTDAEAEAFLVGALASRRDAIGRTYLPAVNPVVDPALDADGTLTFRNAAVDAGAAPAPTACRARWARFDNATGVAQALGDSSGGADGIEPPGGLPVEQGTFLRVEIAAAAPAPAPWQVPVHAYFKRTAAGWTLVGLDRMPEAAATAATP